MNVKNFDLNLNKDHSESKAMKYDTDFIVNEGSIICKYCNYKIDLESKTFLFFKKT